MCIRDRYITKYILEIFYYEIKKSNSSNILFATTGLNTTKASAHSFHWWYTLRKVVVVKTVRINKVQKGVPLNNSHYVIKIPHLSE